MTDDLVNSIKQALRRSGYSVTDEPGIHVIASLRDGSRVALCLQAPESFPYELPEFQLEKDMLSAYGKLPHVAPWGNICAFDKETNYPNASNPEGQVLEVLKKTLDILSDGVEGLNKEDYLDEFLAYWSYGCGVLFPIYSLVDNLGEQPKTLYACSAEPDDQKIYICSTENEAKALLKRLGDTARDPCIFPCAYIPLSSSIDFPLPETHKEWHEVVRKNSVHLSRYEHFLQNSTRSKSVIVFSCPYSDGKRVFAAFCHLGIPSMKGFRKGKTPLKAALAFIGAEQVDRCEYIEISNSRLFSRGGNGNMFNAKVCIVGCGSLGSHLADALASCGVKDFTLIDNQLLRAENIARHSCGFSDIGKYKVDAVGNKLIEGNPNITCEAYHEDAHSILIEALSKILPLDYIFVTTGSFPLEGHFIEKAKNELKHCKLVLMWVEPYAVAAHALVFNSPQDAQKKLFDEQGRFIYSVVNNGSELFKREAGCQSTYVQYSGIDVQSFVLDFVRALMFGGLDEYNSHFAWYGAISHAPQHGAIISPQFESKRDYTHEIERID